MKPWLTRTLWSLGALFFLAMFLLFVWVVINVWPYPSPTPLWSEANLGHHHENGSNAWTVIPKHGQPFPLLIAPFITEDMQSLLPPQLGPFESTQNDDYWHQVRHAWPERARSRDWQDAHTFLKVVLAKPRFIDQEAPHFQTQNVEWVYWLDVHLLAWSIMLEDVLHKNSSAAYESWLKQWRLDVQWMRSARSPLSHILALECLNGDLDILQRMIPKSPPTRTAVMKNAIEPLSLKDITFDRALTFEYLWRLSAINALLGKSESQESLEDLPLAFFNRSLILSDLNKEFADYHKLADRPDSIRLTEPISPPPQATKSRFWWLYNPGGKILRRLLGVNLNKALYEFSVRKQKLRQNKQVVLRSLEDHS